MITPLGQVTGELQDAREWTMFGAFAQLPTLSNTKKNTGAYSIRQSYQTKGIGLQFSPQTTLQAGYWLNHTGFYIAATMARVHLFQLGTSHLSPAVIWKRSGDGLGISVDNIIVALTSAPAELSAQDTWIHVGLTYRSGSDGAMVVWINGLPILSYQGSLPEVSAVYCAGTFYYSSVGSDAIMTIGSNPLGGQYSWANYAYVDDLYVDGDIVNVNEMPPPDRFLFSLASGAGASSQWTPTGQATNIACVDEAVPNDDTDYVKASEANLTDLYSTAGITLPVDYGIVGVVPVGLVKRMASGPTLKFVAADGVNANLESAEKTPGTSYGYLWESMPLAPDGGDWTEAKVNAAQFGVKSTGVYA
jgi:hypothetical protein